MFVGLIAATACVLILLFLWGLYSSDLTDTPLPLQAMQEADPNSDKPGPDVLAADGPASPPGLRAEEPVRLRQQGPAEGPSHDGWATRLAAAKAETEKQPDGSDRPSCVPWRSSDRYLSEKLVSASSEGAVPMSQRIGRFKMVHGTDTRRFQSLRSREEFMRGILPAKPKASRYMVPISVQPAGGES